MRILFVTPYPPSRIRVRGYGFLTHLRHAHDITVMTQCASAQELADVDALRAQGFEVVVVQETKVRSALRSGLALFNPSLPLQAAYARSAQFARAIQEMYAARAFDVVHVEHLRGIASMMPLLRHLPLVWDAVDCISLLSKHTLAAGPNRVVRTVARIEYPRTRLYEAQLLSLVPHTIVTSERDRQAMIELKRTLPGNREKSDVELGQTISVLPNGVDLDYFQPLNQERRRLNLVFSGKMSYHANVATALYLHRHIMPLIWEQLPEVTLTIVGSRPPKAIQQLATDPRVQVTGYVEDMRPYVGLAEVMLSPMVYSVGIQNKVLEAMALGTPVVVAEQAASALGARAEQDLLVARSTQEFASATLRILHNKDLQASLSQHGRAYVEQHHDWSTVTEHLTAIYGQVAEQHASTQKTNQRSVSELAV